MQIIQSERLSMRWLNEDDAEFVLRLVNDPDWLRNIGSKNVHSVSDARRYLQEGPLALYRDHGFGLYALCLVNSQQPIGMCGLIKRPHLPHVDVGYALLPEHRGCGYAAEAVSLAKQHAIRDFDLTTLVAIVNMDNHASAKVLLKNGFKAQAPITLPNEEKPVAYFRWCNAE